MPKLKECVLSRRRLEDDMSPPAAVTAVRTPLWDQLLPPEAQAATATATRFHTDADLIDEFHLSSGVASAPDTKNPVGDGVLSAPGVESRYWPGTTLTN